MTLKIVIYKEKVWWPTGTKLNPLIPPPGKGNVVMAVMSSSEIALLSGCMSKSSVAIAHMAFVQGIQ